MHTSVERWGRLVSKLVCSLGSHGFAFGLWLRFHSLWLGSRRFILFRLITLCSIPGPLLQHRFDVAHKWPHRTEGRVKLKVVTAMVCHIRSETCCWGFDAALVDKVKASPHLKIGGCGQWKWTGKKMSMFAIQLLPIALFVYSGQVTRSGQFTLCACIC